jgi:3-phosphoshikimate 1-carboxyvinyltransferase
MSSFQPLSPDLEAIRVHPVTDLNGTVRLPGSKSITNRALIMAALARGESILSNVLDCDDSRYLVRALQDLGIGVEWNRETAVVRVAGGDGSFPRKEGSFFVGNAGTAMRFLTAALAASGGDYEVDGDERMRERPIRDLVRALAILGADISAPTGCPPVRLGPRPMVGGRANIPGSTSSQFISGILMAAPIVERPVELRLTGDLVSLPYIDLTLQGMREFGASVVDDFKRADGQPFFSVSPGNGYTGQEYTVEGDASSASYFYAAAAVTGSTLRVEGVGKESPQGDARCADVLAAMGCRVKKGHDAITVTGPRPPQTWLKGVDWNCSDIPDVVPTLAVVALFARGKSRFYGVAHLRHKESDRIASVAAELRKLGGEVRELRDGLEVKGCYGPDMERLRGARIETWGDHRLAMAFSVASLALDDVVIHHPSVVAKSFPTFFATLADLGVKVEAVDGS